MTRWGCPRLREKLVAGEFGNRAGRLDIAENCRFVINTRAWIYGRHWSADVLRVPGANFFFFQFAGMKLSTVASGIWWDEKLSEATVPFFSTVFFLFLVISLY